MNSVLLLSGGIDSSAVAAWLRPDVAAVVDYGQLPAWGEIRSATVVAKAFNIPLHTLTANCSELGSGLLAGVDPLPFAPSKEWWPFRNQLLLTLVGAWAIQNGAHEIIVGSVKSDLRFADGTAKFYQHIDALMSMQEGKLRVRAPAINMTSVELIKISGITDEVLGWTHSCHHGAWACGACPGCIKHQEVISTI